MDYEASFVKKSSVVMERTYEINVQNITLFFSIRYNESQKHITLDVEQLTKYLEEFFKILHETVDNMTYRSRINIVVYPFNKKKSLPGLRNIPISVDHINSGYCYINSTENDVNIVIYRIEEFCKVLIHELLHLYHIIPFDEQYDKFVNEQYFRENGSNYILTNEALVELNALILNCIILSKLKEKINLKNLLGSELYNSKKNYKTLFNYFRIQNESQIPYKWKENTNCFAYYIVKYKLLYGLLKKYHIKCLCKTIAKNKLRMTINRLVVFKTT